MDDMDDLDDMELEEEDEEEEEIVLSKTAAKKAAKSKAVYESLKKEKDETKNAKIELKEK